MEREEQGIKIIAGLMLILGLWNIVCDIPSGILVGSIDEVLREGSVGEDIVIHKKNGFEATPPLFDLLPKKCTIS